MGTGNRGAGLFVWAAAGLVASCAETAFFDGGDGEEVGGARSEGSPGCADGVVDCEDGPLDGGALDGGEGGTGTETIAEPAGDGVGLPEVAPAGDAPFEPETECPVESGCFGDPCETGDDCLTGLCVPHMGDLVCTKTCDADCPAGFGCRQVALGGTDPVFLCVSDHSNLCRPCTAAADCAGDGAEAACVSYGDEGSFCGAVCDGDHPCPGGFTCEVAESLGGGTSAQCVADAGVCPCSATATDLALGTGCHVSNEHGSCAGARSCGPLGLGACDAPIPAPEVCNGADDDCDGTTDEGLSCDDGEACTEDTCGGAAGCLHDPAPDGEPCDDGDACTAADDCLSGQCSGTAAVDCDDAEVCTLDLCDPATGCASAAVEGPCSDGDACTLGDSCLGGACAAGVGIACDDKNPCTSDACGGPAGCTHVAVSGACDDGNACTQGDVCKSGACKPGAPIACDDGKPCTVDLCLPEGGCAHEPVAGPCTDGDACTFGDVCQGGGCAPGALLDCDDGNPCTKDVCDPALGCVETAVSGSCDDKNTCTTSDVCVDGACVGQGAKPCDDKNACTTDVCLPGGGCDATPATGSCSDGNPCTTGDSCQGGTCVAGKTQTCDDGNPCTADACGAVGLCVHVAVESGCDDGNPCTVEDACAAGVCVAGLPLACSDGKFCNGLESCHPLVGCVGGPAPKVQDALPCTVDACDEAKDAVTHVPDHAACDDEEFCNGAELCDVLFGCVAGAAPKVSDGVACTVDACDETKDLVLHVPDPTGCDDGAVCNGAESCDVALGCVAGKAPKLDDGVACTLDLCDEELGIVVHVPDAGACDDGSFCNGIEICHVTKGCQPGTPPAVDDGVGCTDDLCDEAKDLVLHVPDAGLCDDGAFCNGAETCHVLSGCVAGPPPKLSDGVACTVDACDEDEDVVFHVPADANCGDGAFCNGAETCHVTKGCQPGAPPAVSDGHGCTEDLCDEDADEVVHLADDGLCDDGAPCNGEETCHALAGCLAGAPPEIDDGIGCTLDLCDDETGGVAHLPDDLACATGGLCVTDVCDPGIGCVSSTTPDCCGNGVVEEGEGCDDSNGVDFDGCTGCLEDAPIVVEIGYTGSVGSWTVPAGVTKLEEVVVLGAGGGQGGTDCGNSGGPGGAGGRAVAVDVPVAPGTVFQVLVGGAGGGGAGCVAGTGGGGGGFSGGGSGGNAGPGGCSGGGGGGGGYSGLFSGSPSAGTALLVAGGGAGGGGAGCSSGGGGGGAGGQGAGGAFGSAGGGENKGGDGGGGGGGGSGYQSGGGGGTAGCDCGAGGGSGGSSFAGGAFAGAALDAGAGAGSGSHGKVTITYLGQAAP